MENIIAILKDAKEKALVGDAKAVDAINEAIHLLEAQAETVEAILNATPAQEDLLPMQNGTPMVINSENVTINYFCDPPLCEK